MKKHKRGFTLIEVVLFLAVTSALFVGIAAGVQGSIFQQRYTDSVQNFAEFLRSVYSQVSNVQNENTGRSDKAIYGKVVTFRAKEDGRGNIIRTYNLIGDVERTQTNGQVGVLDEDTDEVICQDGGSVIGRLQCLGANVLVEQKDVAGEKYVPVGFVEDYTVRWSAEVQRTTAWNDGYGYVPFEGIMIVAHSPSSGNISTYIWTASEDDLKDDPERFASVNGEIRGVIDKIDSCANGSTTDKNVCSDPFNNRPEEGEEPILNTDNFKAQDIDFCVNPNGYEFSTIRRNIRLSGGAHNASAVDVLTEDTTRDDENHDFDHNRCG